MRSAQQGGGAWGARRKQAGWHAPARRARKAWDFSGYLTLGLVLAVVGAVIAGLASSASDGAGVFLGVAVGSVGLIFVQIGVIALGVEVANRPSLQAVRKLNDQVGSLAEAVRLLTPEGQRDRHLEELRALPPPTDVQPGWNRDPLDPTQERFWDGGAWQPGVRQSP